MHVHAPLHAPAVCRGVRSVVFARENGRVHTGIRGHRLADPRHPRRRHEADEQKVQVLLNSVYSFQTKRDASALRSQAECGFLR